MWMFNMQNSSTESRQKPGEMVNALRRQRTTSKLRPESICINFESTLYPGKYIFLTKLMHACKLSHLTRMPLELNCRNKCILNGL